MRTLAAALVVCASGDETSLMQERVSRSGKLSSEGQSRQESMNKLLDTAVDMIKNGVTPDVLEFADAADATIINEVKPAIISEHNNDQQYINNLCSMFDDAIERLREKAEEIANHDSNRIAATEEHHRCRAEEAVKCAGHRRCESQLRERWRIVKREEQIMREIHDSIYDEWCVDPPHKCELLRHEDLTTHTFTDACWLSQPFNWGDHMRYPLAMFPRDPAGEYTGQYPHLSVPNDVVIFRGWSYTRFHEYMEQKLIVECAWREYSQKLTECSALELSWDNQIQPCDDLQIVAREHACTHAIENNAARIEFGEEWDRIVADYNLALVIKSANEQDRKNEWETLTIVQCLLRRVHNNIEESIRTGGPCPTIDSDPDEVRLALEDCHIVTRGCPWDVAPLHPDSLTAHLCLVWCEIPEPPDLPPVEEPACTPEYVAREQAQFLQTASVLIQEDYQGMLADANPYVDPNPDSCPGEAPNDENDILTYGTTLSEAGWAGCAPPLVCVECEGMATILPIPNDPTPAEACHLHEEYLAPGQSNSHSFRCLDGTCASMAGRCNGVANCADASDELGCDADTNWFVPAYVSESYACPADMHADVHFQCGNSMCIDKVGLCNGIDNCGDGSDEAHCSGTIQVTVEATSGRTITVETLGMHTGVFHDRDYNFGSLGHFAGKTFIKYSNDDKYTDHEHVMTKLRTVEPLSVYIVKLADHALPWLAAQGYEESSYTGVSFSGIRQPQGVGEWLPDREVRHKEWQWERYEYNGDSAETVGLSAPHIDSFAASQVYSKTFEAGTISIPGNNGGDGSFLIFLDRPGACDAMTHMMIQGCNNNPQDIQPGCNLADVRCCDTDGSACNSGYLQQTYTFLDGMVSEGTACAAGACNGEPNTWCHSAVTFEQAQNICADNGQRLCTRDEIEADTCCGTGCSHDHHLVWFSDEPPAPVYDSRLTAYWERGNCGVHGNDWNWHWCEHQLGACPGVVETDICESGFAELAVYNGDSSEASHVDESGCQFWYLAQYVCAPEPTHYLYSYEHGGHCAGGWLGAGQGNTFQADEVACSAHCRTVDTCRYFAFCEGPQGCDGQTNCALYSEAGGCPDDNNWAAYVAYENHVQLQYANPSVGGGGLCVSMSSNAREAGCTLDSCVGHGDSDATLQTCDITDAGQFFSYSGGLLRSGLGSGRCLSVSTSSNHGACEPFTLQTCDATNTRQQFTQESAGDSTVWRNVATNLAIDSDSWRNTQDNWIWACPGTNTAKYFNDI